MSASLISFMLLQILNEDLNLNEYLGGIKGCTEIWEALEHLCPVKVHFGQRRTNRTLSISLYYCSFSAYIRHNLTKIFKK